jgi:hypothetical protein
MKKVMLFIMVVLAAGCTVNKKYVEINVEDGELTVKGNVDPQFMRENTSESQENTPTVSPTIQVKPLECANACHAAWAGDLFRGKMEQPGPAPDPDPPPPAEPVVPDDPLPLTGYVWENSDSRPGKSYVMPPATMAGSIVAVRVNEVPFAYDSTWHDGRELWYGPAVGTFPAASTVAVILANGTVYKSNVQMAPTPAPAPPGTVKHTLKIHSTRNPPYYQYYAYKAYDSFPREFSFTAGSRTFQVRLGKRSMPKHVGEKGADYQSSDWIVKDSEVPGRGLTILVHERYGKNQTITVEY